MEVIKISAICITAVVMSLTLKKQAPTFALLLTFATGIIILLSVMPQLKSIIDFVKEIGIVTGENTYINLIFKIIGIAYIAHFAYESCNDAGEKALGVKINTVAKIMILFYGMPIVTSLLGRVNTMVK